jgi:hypothetical protein
MDHLSPNLTRKILHFTQSIVSIICHAQPPHEQNQNGETIIIQMCSLFQSCYYACAILQNNSLDIFMFILFWGDPHLPLAGPESQDRQAEPASNGRAQDAYCMSLGRSVARTALDQTE